MRDEAMVMYDTVREGQQLAVIGEEKGDIFVTSSVRQLIRDNERRFGTGFYIDKKLIEDAVGKTHLRPLWIREKIWVPFTTVKSATYMIVCLDYIVEVIGVSDTETIILLGDHVMVSVAMSKASVIAKLSKTSYIRDVLLKRRSSQYKEVIEERHILKEAGNVFYTLKKK